MKSVKEKAWVLDFRRGVISCSPPTLLDEINDRFVNSVRGELGSDSDLSLVHSAHPTADGL